MLNKELRSLSDHRFHKSTESLKQAKILLDNQMFDGAINRSYYAIFYSIRSILCLVRLDSSKHSGVLSFFDKYFVKSGIFDREFSKIAHTAFDMRQDSDYDDFFYPIAEEAISQYKNAKKFIDEVAKKRLSLINGEINFPEISGS